MEDKILLEDIRGYIKKQPDLLKILDQLDIDEEAYLEALNAMSEEELINTQPIANSTYISE